MKTLLTELNKEVGIKGSMIITPDGFLVASDLGPELEEDLVAAIVSSVLVAVRRSLTEIQAQDEISSCVLDASKGKIMFFDVGNTFLVVVADTNLKMDSSLLAIRSVIHRIKNRRVA